GRVDAVEVLGRHAIGRHDVDGVAERAQQEAPFAEEGGELRADAGEIAGIVDGEVERRDGAEAPYPGEARVVAETRQPLLLQRAESGDALCDRFLVPDVEIGVGGGAGDGIGRERARMEEGAPTVL